MKPAPFAYADPETVDEVLALLREHGDRATLLAGGQSLVPNLNLRRLRPEIVIDLARVSDLGELAATATSVVVGAQVTVGAFSEAHRSRGVAQAIACIGHPQIRCRTTVGGTIALGESAAELPAVAAALDAVVTVRSSGGQREIAIADWFVGPRLTAKHSDELITTIEFGCLTGPSWWAEVARRPQDLPIVGMFVGRGEEGWRVACSGVGSTPVRAGNCEAALNREAGALVAIAALLDELDPPSDALASADHRRSIAASLLRRALDATSERMAA